MELELLCRGNCKFAQGQESHAREHFHLNLLEVPHSCWTTGFPNKPSYPSEKVRTAHPSNAGSYDDGVLGSYQVLL